MTVSVFVGTSVDGFIARRERRSRLSAGGRRRAARLQRIHRERRCARHRPQDLREGLDLRHLAIWGQAGRGSEQSPGRRVRGRGGVVEQMAGPPAGIVARLAATGAHHLYVDGGITIQRFLRAGLVQHLTITRVPVLIGDGIPLFGALPRDIRLRHVATRDFPAASCRPSTAWTADRSGRSRYAYGHVENRLDRHPRTSCTHRGIDRRDRRWRDGDRRSGNRRAGDWTARRRATGRPTLAHRDAHDRTSHGGPPHDQGLSPDPIVFANALVR